MGAFTSKMKWLILPAQSGKTRKAEDMISLTEAINRQMHPDQGEELNIWISANNKLLVYQTTSRIKKDLGAGSSSDDESSDEDCDAVIKGNIFSWTSGHKNTNIRVGELARAVTRRDASKRVDMIIMCAHHARFKYLNELLEDISGDINRRISIWIDEADRTINLWSRYADILRHAAVRRVTMVSATFETGLETYGRISILPYSRTAPDCYRSLADCKAIYEEGPSNAVEYVGAVLEKHRDRLVVPGMKAFIPGDISKKSHEEICTLLREKYGFVVLILNGDSKQIRFPDGRAIDLRPYLTIRDPREVPDEFNKILSCLYNDHEIYNYPMAVTGLMCVERGVTFQSAPIEGVHDGFLFDYAIVPSMSSAAESYQTMARMFGNIGNHPGYCGSEIYSTKKMFEQVTKQETLAINIAKMVQEYNLPDVGDEEVTMTVGGDLDALLTKKKARVFNMRLNDSVRNEAFSSLEDLRARWQELSPGADVPGRDIRTAKDGKYKCSIGKTSEVQNAEAVRKWLAESGVASWGSALTEAMKRPNAERKGKMLASVKVGYDGDVPTFFLRYLTMPDEDDIDDVSRSRMGGALGGGNPF
jgi:hypothetical protein